MPFYYYLDQIFDTLEPIAIFVVMPIVIVYMFLRYRRYELNKRTDVMLKAIECGVPMDSPIIQQMIPTGVSAKKKDKQKVQRSLVASIIVIAVGLLPFVIGLRCILRYNSSPGIEQLSDAEILAKEIEVLIFLLGTFLLLIGVALLVIHFVRKKAYEKELAESNGDKVLE
jgi:hypothetical protein